MGHAYLLLWGARKAGFLDMIYLMHRRLVEEKFQRKNGYEADCDVIYGDTDSVMVNFRVKDIARAMELGREAAAFVSKTFIKPIKLEFEKVCTGISPGCKEKP